MLRLLFLSLLAAFIAPAIAQTSTSCQPLNVTCPDEPALGMAFNWNMTNTTLDTSGGIWNMTGPGITYNDSNAAFFTMEKPGDAPTIHSNFYIFWGSVSVIMKAAKGQGVVSSIVLLSSDLDEIDWEWIGGNNTHVQTNYYGKGNTSATFANGTNDRYEWIPVSNPQDEWHNYTTVWNQEQLQWILDGQVVRTLTYDAADGQGKFYPQTPSQVSLGMWDGGNSSSNWTRLWAGGETDFSQGPFTMQVSNVYINDGQRNVSTYTYGDKSGSFKSIQLTNGQNALSESLAKPPPESISQHFNDLSSGAKIAIFASIGGVVVILLALCACCCVRQRKAGRKERALADAEWDKSTAELMAYRTRMKDGGFGFGGGRERDSIPLSPNPQFKPLGEKF